MATDTAGTVQVKLDTDSVKVEVLQDEWGWGGEGLEHLGEYSDKWAPGCIDRQEGENGRRREYRYWHWLHKPGAILADLRRRGWAKQPAAEEVARWKAQDFARCEAYKEGRWWFVGVRAKAAVKVGPGGRAGGWRVHEFDTAGLWGIESDSGREYFAEVGREQLADLRADLEAFGVAIDDSAWAGIVENAVNEMEA